MPDNVNKGGNDAFRGARSGNPLAGDLNAIALRCAKRTVISQLTDDEILGYDESGTPTR
jgi:hypothetical protein